MNIFAVAIDWTGKKGIISAQDLCAAAQTSEWFPYSSLPKSLIGKDIVFTGTLPTLTRIQAENMATKAGAHSRGTVSKNTDLVVVGVAWGSKIQKAKKYGIKIINEQEFVYLTELLFPTPKNLEKFWSPIRMTVEGKFKEKDIGPINIPINKLKGLYVRGESQAIVRYYFITRSDLIPLQEDMLKVPGATNTEIHITGIV